MSCSVVVISTPVLLRPLDTIDIICIQYIIPNLFLWALTRLSCSYDYASSIHKANVQKTVLAVDLKKLMAEIQNLNHHKQTITDFLASPRILQEPTHCYAIAQQEGQRYVSLCFQGIKDVASVSASTVPPEWVTQQQATTRWLRMVCPHVCVQYTGCASTSVSSKHRELHQLIT